MSQANKDPEVFLTQVNEAIEEVEAAINAFLEASVTAFNAAIAAAHAHANGLWEGVKGGLGGFLSGGIPGAVAGAGSGYVEGFVDELVQQLEQGSNLIDAEWRDASATIRQAIGSMLGDPVKMSSISSHYRDAIEELGQVKSSLTSANRYLEATWTGRAFIAYNTTSEIQLAALDGTISTLQDSADLMDDHALNLVLFWTRQLQNLVDLAASITKEATEIGDIGNWVSAGAGVVVSMIATAASGASSILTDTASYWAELNIGKAGDWDSVQSLLGSRGLENDQWPQFTSLDRSAINGPWETRA
jgi:uncharacterized protein YukE